MKQNQTKVTQQGLLLEQIISEDQQLGR